jgi:hypothetical protein
MVVAASIIPRHAVLIFGGVPQVQETIRVIVTIRFTVCGAAKPPSGVVLRRPCFLRCIARVHRITGASTTTVLGTGNINDPVWCSQGLSRRDERLPIAAAPR